MVTCTTILTSSSKYKIATKICEIYIWKVIKNDLNENVRE